MMLCFYYASDSRPSRSSERAFAMKTNQDPRITWLGIIVSSLIILWVVVTIVLKR